MKRLLPPLCASLMWWALPLQAEEALKYEWTRHLDGPAACHPLINTTGRYHEWVDCVADKLPPLDPKRRNEFGQSYDPEKWRACRHNTKPPVASCEELRLRRRPEPEYWPPGSPKSSINWPAPPKTSVYRQGMTPRQYFDALCATEAGEFIYRTVENVEGIYQIRPRIKPTDTELQDRYVLADPVGVVSTWGGGDTAMAYGYPGTYSFIERPNVYLPHSRESTAPILRLITPSSLDVRQKIADFLPTTQTVVTARYGFTWREISRPRDRDHYVAGSELAIVDLRTREILALRRGFALGGPWRNSLGGAWWLGAGVCPLGSGPAVTAEVRFVRSVLRPPIIPSSRR